RTVKGCPVVHPALVRVCTMIEEEGDDLDPVGSWAVDGKVEARETVVRRQVWIGAIVETPAHRRGRTGGHGIQEDVRLAGDPGPVPGDSVERRAIARAHRDAERSVAPDGHPGAPERARGWARS